MKVNFAFGKTGLALDLPENLRYRTLEVRSAGTLPNIADELRDKLKNPIASPGLQELARGKRSAAISICDITRPAPNSVTLPPILECLEQAGIPRDAISILIATGLHRPATDAEIREICGSKIAATCKVLNHDARDLAAHRFLGATSTGTPVYIDDRFVSADLHITLGFIEPHLMAGFSGGRKLIAPGLASQETIKVLHSPRFMRDPRSAEGFIDDNPMHRELLEIAAMARHDFLLDVVLSHDRSIAGIFAGNPGQAHRQGVDFISRTILEQLDEPLDGVITSAAGYPLDLTFYQAIKGITAAAHIVKPGGHILLIAACEEGAGAPEFENMLRSSPSDRQFLHQILNAPVTVDQWQLEKLALVTTSHRVFFYVPGLPTEYWKSLWGPAFTTIADAIQGFADKLPDQANIAVIPDGPYVLAKVLAAKP
jgi:nickel-dependent lactate racemase